jgi:hypothetical protein
MNYATLNRRMADRTLWLDKEWQSWPEWVRQAASQGTWWRFKSWHNNHVNFHYRPLERELDIIFMDPKGDQVVTIAESGWKLAEESGRIAGGYSFVNVAAEQLERMVQTRAR